MAEWLHEAGVLKVSPEGAMGQYNSWAVWDDWGISQGEFFRWWRLGIEAGAVYGRGPMINGARDALWKLSDAEYHIHIATSRLTKMGMYEKIVENTVGWLRDNAIPYRSLTFTDRKQDIQAYAIVDDLEKNMSEESHRLRFLFKAQHNGGSVEWKHILEELL